MPPKSKNPNFRKGETSSKTEICSEEFKEHLGASIPFARKGVRRMDNGKGQSLETAAPPHLHDIGKLIISSGMIIRIYDGNKSFNELERKIIFLSRNPIFVPRATSPENPIMASNNSNISLRSVLEKVRNLRIVLKLQKQFEDIEAYEMMKQLKEMFQEQRSKHILRRFHLILEIIEHGDAKICKVDTNYNIADLLTKPLPQLKHQSHTRSTFESHVKLYIQYRLAKDFSAVDKILTAKMDIEIEALKEALKKEKKRSRNFRSKIKGKRISPKLLDTKFSPRLVYITRIYSILEEVDEMERSDNGDQSSFRSPAPKAQSDLLQLAKLRLAPPSLVKHRLLLLLIVPSLLHSSKKNLTFGFVKGRIRDRISQIWFLLELLQNLFATLHILEVPLLISPLSTKQFASDKPHSKWIRNFFDNFDSYFRYWRFLLGSSPNQALIVQGVWVYYPRTR
ncbi:hypothetical protein M9H77_12031 [Catharanthus roseus]|uniref:Uncharacterized protein n=1 Tax=Catharanthus roseus TaxID=4058 RepID=A0ACC0BGF1_CATRO|nr:hypothetical protein M9H77_12031 [Catharanthus roseus]